MVLRIDAHNHLWDPAHRRPTWWSDAVLPIQRKFSLDQLCAEMASHGFGEVVVVEAFADTQETVELLELAARSDAVAGVVGWVDLTAADVTDALASLTACAGGAALVGVRHPVHDEPDPCWLVRPEVVRGLRAVADADLTFDLLVRARELPAAARLARQLPSLRLVLDHLGKPPLASGDDVSWGRGFKALAAYGNVSCKLSGLVTEAAWRRWRPPVLVQYIDRAVEAFGPDRLMFGSDWPVCLLSASYTEVVELAESALAGLAACEIDLVFGGTARRVYQLSGEVT